MEKDYILEWIDTNAGKIPKVSSELNKSDKLGSLKVRLAFNRNNYKVDPGIYAIGDPSPGSDVFVSANYKLSFDILRTVLHGISAWILVLDTKGINVWCAAGKGTFGTKELIWRIRTTDLNKIVNHTRIIVPQLGAPGVAAYKVKKYSKFSVTYGPVRAYDIQAFLEANKHATPEMRQVKFSFPDRLLLVPVEIVASFKYLAFLIAGFFILSGLNKDGYSFDLLFSSGINSAINLTFAYLAGAALAPVLLPWLPGRSFSMKGFFTGLIFFMISLFCKFAGDNYLEIISWFLLITSISSFLTMNFTGASTYTSLTGVKKEMKYAVPVQIAFGGTGFILWILCRFI